MTDKTDVCPTCGQPLQGRLPLPKAVEHVVCGPTSKRILRALARAEGAYLTTKELARIIYADDEDGGPLDASTSITVMISRLRSRLLAHGLEIPDAYRNGYALRWRHEHIAKTADAA